jgi:hypothetical protein
MNPTILFYSGLALVWLVMAVLIALGLHERFLGQADDWKKYLAMGICMLMVLWNIVRIMRIRVRLQQQSRTRPASGDEE